MFLHPCTQVGSFLGLMSDRGRGGIFAYVGNVVYNIVALGLMAMVRQALYSVLHALECLAVLAV